MMMIMNYDDNDYDNNDIWKTRKPLSYNVPSLLAVLEAQVRSLQK